MFSKIGKDCLKVYNKSKKIEDALGNIYMEYLNALHSQKLITFARDPIYREIKGVNLKLAAMFLIRFLDEMNKK